MDSLTLLRFVHDHNDKVIGGLVVLFLATSILLLIRSIGEKNENPSSHVKADVDLSGLDGAIEDAMKRVLSSQTINVASVTPVAGHSPSASASTASDAGAAAGTGASADAVRERDARIVQLSQELEKSRNELNEAVRVGSATAGGGGGDGANGELQAKLEELQARLSEYEIIEDDIADLSLYKEENVRLKEELEILRVDIAKAAANPSPAAPPASKIRTDNELELKFEKTDKFELDENDDIMKEFAAAVGGGAPAPVAPSKAPAAPAAPAAEDQAQSAIDAMFAQAQESQAAPAAAAPVLEPAPEADSAQSAIDAMLEQAIADSNKAVAAEPEMTFADPQAEIDAMFASSAASIAVDPPKPAEKPDTVAEPVVETVAEALVDALDTDKMLSEVAALEAAVVEDQGDALEDKLDTDKLIEEVVELERHPVADSATEPIMPPEPQVETVADIPAEDDVLAEFKDSRKAAN